MIYTSAAYEAATAQPMTHSRILWNNLAAGAAFSSADEADGFEALNAQSVDTFSWWQPAAAANLQVDFAAPVSLSCIGIAGHTLGSAGVGLTLERWTGSAWAALMDAEIVAADDAPIMACFAPVTLSRFRIVLDGVARIGTLHAGPVLEMPVPEYGAHPALAMVRQTTFRINKSVSGVPLGRTIQSVARPVKPEWSHLPEAWVRSTLDPFLSAARTQPFFLATRPSAFPEDVAYLWTSADLVPERMGLRDYMRLTITAEAEAEASE